MSTLTIQRVSADIVCRLIKYIADDPLIGTEVLHFCGVFIRREAGRLRCIREMSPGQCGGRTTVGSGKESLESERHVAFIMSAHPLMKECAL